MRDCSFWALGSWPCECVPSCNSFTVGASRQIILGGCLALSLSLWASCRSLSKTVVSSSFFWNCSASETRTESRSARLSVDISAFTLKHYKKHIHAGGMVWMKIILCSSHTQLWLTRNFKIQTRRMLWGRLGQILCGLCFNKCVRAHPVSRSFLVGGQNPNPDWWLNSERSCCSQSWTLIWPPKEGKTGNQGGI